MVVAILTIALFATLAPGIALFPFSGVDHPTFRDDISILSSDGRTFFRLTAGDDCIGLVEVNGPGLDEKPDGQLLRVCEVDTSRNVEAGGDAYRLSISSKNIRRTDPDCRRQIVYQLDEYDLEWCQLR